MNFMFQGIALNSQDRRTEKRASYEVEHSNTYSFYNDKDDDEHGEDSEDELPEDEDTYDQNA